MATLQVEHAISDFEVRKKAFEADPVRRKESGVRRYRVFRPVDDPHYVKIDLDFDSVEQAEAFRAALQGLWGSGRAAPALSATPQTQIVEEVLAEQL
jgi:hypothetical protein